MIFSCNVNVFSPGDADGRGMASDVILMLFANKDVLIKVSIQLSSSVNRKKYLRTFVEDATNVDHMI